MSVPAGERERAELMSPVDYYRKVWIHNDPLYLLGDWPMKFAYCYASYIAEAARREERKRCAEIANTLKEIEGFLAELASSALLAGEEHLAADRSEFYSGACKTKNLIMWAIEELTHKGLEER